MYVAPPSGEPSCRLPTAACSPVADDVAGRGADPASGDGCLMAGSMESPELANSALRLPGSRLERRWEDFRPPPGALLRLPAGTTVFFFLDVRAILSSLRSAGVTCKVDIALIKANSSCLNIATAGALLPLSSLRFAAVSVSQFGRAFLPLSSLNCLQHLLD